MAKRKKADTEAQRKRRHIVSLHKKTRENLEALNVDVDAMFREDPVELRKVHKATLSLREMHERMRRASGDQSAAMTPQRQAHSPVSVRPIDIGPNQAPAQKFDWVLDGLRDRLSTRQYEAAERLRKAWDAMQPKSAVASLEGAGGGSDPMGRLPLSEAQEIAARDVAWVMDRLPTSELRQAVENFVLERSPFGDDGGPLSLEDYGSRICKFGSLRNRVAAIRDVVHACAFLDHLWHMRAIERKHQCARTDLLMRSEIGRRAGREGWICALWDYAYVNGRLPKTDGEVAIILTNHDSKARAIRQAPQMVAERFYQRRDRLTALAFRVRDERMRAA